MPHEGAQQIMIPTNTNHDWFTKKLNVTLPCAILSNIEPRRQFTSRAKPQHGHIIEAVVPYQYYASWPQAPMQVGNDALELAWMNGRRYEYHADNVHLSAIQLVAQLILQQRQKDGW